ncbi:MAG TPA: hypothetical protein VMQ78_05355 [Candidatus Limnocylindria bacterium]|nr:hypothetical protein [Candidatus Limnocylindria bacterium]
MKELLEGRRLGFAPRASLAFVAIGLGLAATIVDLMAWFGWGGRDTNPFVIAAQWLVVTTFVVVGIAAITAVVEYGDVDREDRGLARMDEAAAIGALLLYGISAALRSFELSQAAVSPAPFLLAIAGLVLLIADAGLAANLYSAREWEELEDEPIRERHPRRRAAGR